MWRCDVCGYVHREPAVPDCCPVCGAARSYLKPYVEQIAPTPSAPQSWRCVNCAYVHRGSEPAEPCPVCGAPPDHFEPVKEAVEKTARQVPSRVVIVGAGIAGLSAAQAVRETAPQSQILLISKEAALPYYRLNLTRYLAGEIGETQLPIYPESWYTENRIELLRETEVTKLLPEEKAVVISTGEKLPFDKLILTAGSHPFLPPFPGAYRQGVTTFRTVSDAKTILAAAKAGARCVCIGGGILGLETAGALARQGADVTLLEGFGWLLPRQLTQNAARILESRVKEIGIHLLTGAQTGEIVGDERVAGVQLKDGKFLPADLVVVSTGVRPNSYLARLAGLEVNQGIVVDNHLASSRPDIYAAGDVAEHRGVLYGIWSPSQYQGSIAGLNAAGASTEFGGVPKSNMLKVLGVELFSIGKIEPDDASFTVIEQAFEDRFFRFVFRDAHLVGAILLGEAALAIPTAAAINHKADFSGQLTIQPTVQTVIDHLRKM